MLSSEKPQKFQNYRSDIDGLRAIAVLSVILFHINKDLMPGGFVGVDIFFVISGYLISLHIFRDIELARFSLIEFYRRRVKRIAPAMLLVVMITLLLAQLVLRPEDAEKAAESGLWSLFSLANVYFWLYQDTSYFAAASSQMPLLHLWSLGVEEQFYIFWPLILMLIYHAKRSRSFFIISALLALFSFLLGEFLYGHAPSFVYYMLPTRAGELLIGALTAQIILNRGSLTISTKIVSLSATSGMFLIAASLILLSEEQVFPGLRAIPPTIGTAMLILAGHFGRSWPSRLLMLRPMIWVGLVSYSAYLWHWPILAFYRYSQLEISLFSGSIIFTLTLFLAWLTYRYVETPTRHSSLPAIHIFTHQYILPAGALALLAVAFMKIDGYGLRWMSDDYKNDLTAMKNEMRPANDYDYVCQRGVIKTNDINNNDCIIGDNTSNPPQAILWGDSNAAHYIGMLGVFAREEKFRFRNIAVSACPPINADPKDFAKAKRLSNCRNSREITWQTVNSFPVVMISANWSSYQERSKDFLDTFFDTAQTLAKRGKLVILIGKAPVIHTYDRLCREKALSLRFMQCITPDTPLSQSVADANNRLKSFAAKTKNVEYYEITSHICPDGKCSAFDHTGKPMYFDPHHLTLTASWELGDYIYQSEGVPFPFTLVSDW